MSGLAFAPPRHDNRTPALVLAVALHVAVFFAVMVSPHKPLQPVGSSVPIKIVSTAPYTDTRPAVQAPQTQAAATPEPAPQAQPQPPAPMPAPTPAFTQTVPKPTPTPKPPVAQVSQHAATQASQAVDFNRMQQIIENARRAAGAPASNAQKGPARAETAPQARPDAGQGLSQSDLTGLQQLLERQWSLQCNMPGVDAIGIFKVTFTVTLSGQLLRPPTAGGLENSSDAATAIVVRRALDAVRSVVPFAEPYYGQTITVNFNPKKARESKCSN
ncbi:MAG TPA: energy transducer TonB [Caulobacteraceae bacterium]|jgi:outer membrane biosynthesis protein TonB